MAPAMVFLPALAVSGTVLIVLLGVVLADVVSTRKPRG
jgi:hypothetical protein